jgi:hypothetical protein
MSLLYSQKFYGLSSDPSPDSASEIQDFIKHLSFSGKQPLFVNLAIVIIVKFQEIIAFLFLLR